MSTAITGMPIPKDVLERMPPAQRAGKGDTHTSRSCVTRQDLDRGELLGSDKANCTRKVKGVGDSS